MSQEFVMVGRLQLSDVHEVVVGVKPDTGDVQAYLNGPRDYKGLGLPPVLPAIALAWAELLQKAASAAGPIVAARRQYQAAVEGAVERVQP
ncbi:hypothetical protein SEA_FEYRE_56 [Mycobacterium phage Feyre]